MAQGEAAAEQQLRGGKAPRRLHKRDRSGRLATAGSRRAGQASIATLSNDAKMSLERLAAIVVAIVGILAYLNTLPAGFTFDDSFAVVRPCTSSMPFNLGALGPDSCHLGVPGPRCTMGMSPAMPTLCQASCVMTSGVRWWRGCLIWVRSALACVRHEPLPQQLLHPPANPHCCWPQGPEHPIGPEPQVLQAAHSAVIPGHTQGVAGAASCVAVASHRWVGGWEVECRHHHHHQHHYQPSNADTKTTTTTANQMMYTLLTQRLHPCTWVPPPWGRRDPTRQRQKTPHGNVQSGGRTQRLPCGLMLTGGRGQKTWMLSHST